MNSKGAPDFSTAVEIPSSDNHDWERYSDKLWKIAYEKGKEDEKRWWSGFCAKCTDADRPQGKWEYHSNPAIGINPEDAFCSYCKYHIDTTMVDFDDYNYCPNCGCRMKGADDE
jgi:hypothetical protein